METIKETKQSIKDNEDLLKKYTYYSEMFGFSDAVEGSQKTLEIINNEIAIITTLWDHIDTT